MTYSKEAVLEVVNIPAIVSELIPAGKQRGDEWEARCPFHDDKTPSFGINLSTGEYNCFGCGEHGDIFDLYGRLKGLSFPEAMEALGKDSSYHPRQNGNHPGKSEKRPLLSMALG